MRLSITGHRPEKIPDEQAVKEWLGVCLYNAVSECVYVGMASGVDLWTGLAAIDLGIPVIACKPWAGHKPRIADAEAYEAVIEHAREVVNVHPSETYPGPWVYQKRNEYMVDRTDRLLAVWDYSSGGTCNCINYAIAVQTPIKRLNPLSLDTTYFKKGQWVETLSV